jgi:hypothetical protein
MRKILVVLFVVFLAGCNNMSYEKELYLSMIDELKVVGSYDIDIPCDIDVSFDSLGDEFIYRVIIDNPNEEMYNIKALVIHDVETDDIFPSVGIFDETINMQPNVVNDDFVKGIILSGYIDSESEIKVLISYEDSDGLERTVYYKD